MRAESRLTNRASRPGGLRALPALVVCLLLAGVGPRGAAQGGRTTPLEPIRYTLRFPAPHTHYVEVEALVPTGRQPAIEMMMAVWTPGSYLIREYSRHVEGVTARTAAGAPLSVEKTQKNRWRIVTGGADRVTVSYRVYCREMGVRNNWVDAEFAMVNGAPTFLTLAERVARPHMVRVELPSTWSTAVTGLPPAPGEPPHTYVAADFDTLVDSPIVAGNPALYEFQVDGKPHVLANVGEAGVWDGPRSAADVERIVREHRRMWGFLPYDRYVFLNLLTDASGGLEHKNSTLLMTRRWATRSRRSYLGWLSLVSHEYFHLWNVKRLRPVELGPFDYERELYTRSLWIAEGFTDYYADLAVHRAGLSTREEFLEALSRPIADLQTTPGRRVQSVEQASFDAWIKQYRPDENFANTAISYYTKGAVIAFLLDAKIRRATAGGRSLDDLMRLAYRRYSGERGFTPEEFRRTASDVAGLDLGPWFRGALETTDELDYQEALDWFGLRFRPAPSSEGPGRPWLGATTRADGGRLLVTQVRRDTPAYEAGLNVDDEIVAIEEFRVPASDWTQFLDYFRPGDRVSMLVARRGRLERLTVTLGREPQTSWRLEVRPDASADQRARLDEWLQPSR
jgi:predicted metalloprotease with PDZ domain